MERPSYYRLRVHAGREDLIVNAPTERDICIAGEQIVRHLFSVDLTAMYVIEGPDAECERRVRTYLIDVLSELGSSGRELHRLI